jgi:5-methylcytosine-specific restriction endonuclease McrA
MARFELRRLDNYDDASLLNELQRVASLVKSPVLTQSEFDRHSKASTSLIRRRFGGWARALALAGLGLRFSGTPEAKRVLTRGARTFTDEELLTELRGVAAKLGVKTITIEQFNRHGTMNAETIRRRFGSWWRAVERAGLTISNLGKRYSEADYFENLLKVWTHYGRQPTYGEMDQVPSWIRAGAYEAKWGTWRNALKAFLERVNVDMAESRESENSLEVQKLSQTPRRGSQRTKKQPSLDNTRRRDITLGLRYDVLRRDRFRCVICGASPASKVGCELHVDHINPLALGGRTVLENLRTLCSDCNVGKGTKVEHKSSTV